MKSKVEVWRGYISAPAATTQEVARRSDAFCRNGQPPAPAVDISLSPLLAAR